MATTAFENTGLPQAFGQRHLRPRVCIADQKRHIRAFLSEALDDHGFIVSECATPDDLDHLLQAQAPDLLVLGFSCGGIAAAHIVTHLADHGYSGLVLPIGPRHLPAIAAVQDLGLRRGLAMLPLLATPFSDEGLRDAVATLGPGEPLPQAPVDVAEALAANWLELWYQPKIDLQTMTLAGIEAAPRMRHPAWGVVVPTRLVPAADDPHFRAYVDLVMSRAVTDWHHFLNRHGPVRLSLNLPLAFFSADDAIATLVAHLPDHPAFHPLMIELDANEIADQMEFANEIARQLRFHNVAVAIDNLGPTLPALMALDDIAFAEIGISASFAAGCADSALQRVACRQIIDAADNHGVRTRASGIDDWLDLVCLREMGVVQVQGEVFSDPVPTRKFEREILGRASFASQPR